MNTESKELVTWRRGQWGLAGLGIVVALIALAPYLLMFVTSLKPAGELFSEPSQILPREWTWSNYIDVWSAAPVAEYLWNSIVIAGSATAIVLVCAVPAAYYVARHRFRGRAVFVAFAVITQMIPSSVVITGIYREVVAVGLVNTQLAVIIIDAGFTVAFALLILIGSFRAIPEEIEEAAQLDGASRLRTLFSVALPLTGPGLVTAAVFTFVGVWNEYIVALTLLSDSEKLPISVGITDFVGRTEIQYQFMFAAALFAVVPIVMLFALVEKRLASGITAGATK